MTVRVIKCCLFNLPLGIQADGYTCGVETWYLPRGGAAWQPGQCLLTSKPGWAGGLVGDSDGAFWAPALLDDRTMLYAVPPPFDDEGGASCLAWLRCEFKFLLAARVVRCNSGTSIPGPQETTQT